MIFDLSKEFDARKARERLQRLIEAKAVVDLSQKRKRRSTRANSYYWAILTFFGIHSGYTPQEIHTVCKRAYGLTYTKNGQKFLRSTKDLDSKEMASYIEWIRNTAAKQGVCLASAEEYQEGGWVEIDRFNKQNKQYTGD